MYVSVLGDSMSTYKGWSNNVIGSGGEYYTPENFGGVDNMWWKKVMNSIGAEPASIDAIGGTCVGFYDEGNDDDNHIGKKWCMNNQRRVEDLGSSITTSGRRPDAVLFFGGTNDLCRSNFDVNTFINNYSNTLRLIYNRYTNNPIIMCITPYECYLTTCDADRRQKYENMLYGISSTVNYYRSFGYRCVFVTLKGTTFGAGDKDGVEHPTASGMQLIANRVIQEWNRG